MLLSLETELFVALKAPFVSFVNRIRNHAAKSSDRLCCHFRSDNVTNPFPVKVP